MKFRTELEPHRPGFMISHETAVLLLGSCFSDNIGSRLEHDGFDVMTNPFGTLYNPLSIANTLERALSGRYYTSSDLTIGPRGWHCLDFSTAFSGDDAGALLKKINCTLRSLSDFLHKKPVVIITFGTAWYFTYTPEGGRPIGNCHKFPGMDFIRMKLNVEEITGRWRTLSQRLFSLDCNIIYTVSPIRHLADGLHGNNLSKATLLLAVEELTQNVGGDYFPAYEAVIDDLRDYRFYAADMKHPSETAADYVYSLFSQAYFTPDTISGALVSRKQYLRSQHRQILK